MANVKVTIIIPSYNVVKYIEECLKSVVNQSLKEVEIICVDANSTDGTKSIIEKYAKLDNRIRLIESNIKSYGYQVNTGIKIAKGEYIGIVESDDFINKEMYETLYLNGIKYNADIVKGPYIEYYSKRRFTNCYFSEKMKNIPKNRCFSAKEYGYILSFHASVWSAIYKCEYLKINKLFFVEAPNAGYVDVDFRIQTIINTNRILWVDKALYYYRVDSLNSSTSNFKLDVMAKRWNEEHKKINSNDYDNYYGKFLVFDEYLNTIAYLKYKTISKKTLEMLIENISYIKEFIIKDSPVLNSIEKKEMLQFKKNPTYYVKKQEPLLFARNILRVITLKILPKGSKRRKIAKSIRLQMIKKENG